MTPTDRTEQRVLAVIENALAIIEDVQADMTVDTYHLNVDVRPLLMSARNVLLARERDLRLARIEAVYPAAAAEEPGSNASPATRAIAALGGYSGMEEPF